MNRTKSHTTTITIITRHDDKFHDVIIELLKFTNNFHIESLNYDTRMSITFILNNEMIEDFRNHTISSILNDFDYVVGIKIG